MLRRNFFSALAALFSVPFWKPKSVETGITTEGIKQAMEYCEDHYGGELVPENLASCIENLTYAVGRPVQFTSYPKTLEECCKMRGVPYR